MDATEQQSRYYWVDVVKALGIFFVFYGHVLQRTYRLSTEDVFLQYKLVYAFHMPLFFFVAGFFFKRKYPSTWTEIGVLFQKRIFPVILFELMALLIRPVYSYLKFGAVDFLAIFTDFPLCLQGQPLLNTTTWFLVCLFAAEIWAVFVLPKIKNILPRLLISIFFLAVGFSATANVRASELLFGLPKNFWYVHESLVAFGFYALGYSVFGWMKKMAGMNIAVRICLFILFASITIFTFNLNSGSPADFVVIMKMSEHGNPYFFLLTAMTGILAILLLASLIPQNRWVEYVGKNTLILLGMNGLFLGFVNSHVVEWLNHYHSTALAVFDSIWISFVSIVLSIPVVAGLNKWLPQLVGRPQVDGALLKVFSFPRFSRIATWFSALSQKVGSIRE